MPDFPPDVFYEVFAASERPILLGGQAVNLWATIYESKVPALQNYTPFTSFDADIFGTPALGASVAQQCGWSILTNHDPRNPISAILTKETEKGLLRVDVLRSILGVSSAEIEASADEYEFLPGKICRIPSPPLLLKAKIANLHQLDNTRNDGSPRNDLKHVSMLIPICAHYTRHMTTAVKNGVVRERDLINTLHGIRAIIHSASAVEVAQKYSLDFSQTLPPDLDATGLPKLANFYANLQR
jgi:hypothetical protein